MRTLDRRSFIQTGTATALASAGGMLTNPAVWVPLSCTAPTPTGSSPGFYRFRLGDLRITVLGDGHFPLPADFFGADVPVEQRTAYYEARLLPPDTFRLPANPILIESGERRILVDSGRGAPGEPPQSTGWLIASLAAAGIAPQSIDLVVLTHAHPDHIGGLVDPGTQALRFANAEVALSESEYAVWTAADVTRRVPAWVAEWGIVDFNRASFAALGERIRTVPADGEIAPGLHSVSTPGHTPGHIGVLVTSGSEQMIMVGDAIVTPHTHFEHPEWRLAVDHDPEQGVRTRQRLLDRIATDRILVQGFHLPFPGIGHAVREAGAYRWLPAG